jgi:hypothetical protein
MNNSTQRQVAPEIPLRWHFDPAQAHVVSPSVLWGWSRTADVIPGFNTSVEYSRTRDLPKFSLPCMQDLVRTKVNINSELVSQDGAFMSLLLHLNPRYYNIGIPGEVVALSDAYVLSNLVDDATGFPVNLFDVVSLRSAQSMYDRLETPIQTTIKHIKSPDDSEFSIWYLIRDLYEIPRLCKGLIKSMRTLKSLFTSTQFLAALFSRKTMKEIASLHLANEYGIKPTISDFREFAELLLKWYHTWKKKSSKLGSLRTYYSGPNELVKGYGVNQRCRFPTFGAGISHANISGDVGPLVHRLTAKYYFVAPDLTKTIDALTGIIDDLGLFDPAAIWDAIPFSFVVDWFFNVTGFLTGHKLRFNRITLVICDWCESISCESRLRVSLDYTGFTDFSIGERVHVGEKLADVRIFQRARRNQAATQLNVDPTEFLGKGLTLRRVINGSALILQHRVRGKAGRSNYRKNHLPSK